MSGKTAEAEYSLARQVNYSGKPGHILCHEQSFYIFQILIR